MARKPASSAAPLDADARVVVLHGKDAHQRSEHTAALRKALEARDPDLDVLTFDGQSAKAADVLDECRSFGLMARHKLVFGPAAPGGEAAYLSLHRALATYLFALTQNQKK